MIIFTYFLQNCLSFFYSSIINFSIYFTLFLTFHFILNKYKFILYINIITLHYYQQLTYCHSYLKIVLTYTIVSLYANYK